MGKIFSSVSTVALAAALCAPAGAQTNCGQFGGQCRADSASQMIVLGVQQGISSLPPTSGQSFVYDYNAELGTFEASEQLGPTVLRAPQTIGANRFSMRAAVSYFELDQTFDPLIYEINVPPNERFPPTFYAQFGMSAKAHVTLLNFAGTYGITDRIEVSLNIPVAVVQAQARQIYTVARENAAIQPPSARPLGAVGTLPNQTPQEAFAEAFANPGPRGLVFAESSFTSLGFDFNAGTHAGVGRISVGGKGLLYANDWVDLAFSTEFFCNSPSEDQFAGSNSPAILPRAIGQVKLLPRLRMHSDVGYDYDFETEKLSRLTWNFGFSIPIVNATFDFGVGGSKFDSPIRWTPYQTTGTGPPTQGFPNGIPATLTSIESGANKLGTNYVDFLGGLKVRIVEGLVVSGGVNVPVNDEGFRAAAVGTAALEYYF